MPLLRHHPGIEHAVMRADAGQLVVCSRCDRKMITGLYLHPRVPGPRPFESGAKEPASRRAVTVSDIHVLTELDPL